MCYMLLYIIHVYVIICYSYMMLIGYSYVVHIYYYMLFLYVITYMLFIYVIHMLYVIIYYSYVTVDNNNIHNNFKRNDFVHIYRIQNALYID